MNFIQQKLPEIRNSTVNKIVMSGDVNINQMKNVKRCVSSLRWILYFLDTMHSISLRWKYEFCPAKLPWLKFLGKKHSTVLLIGRFGDTDFLGKYLIL